MHTNDIVFSGYLFRMDSENIEAVRDSFRSGFDFHWSIELIAKSLSMFYATPTAKVNLSMAQIWDFYQTLSALEGVMYVENDFSSTKGPGPTQLDPKPPCPRNANTDKKYKWVHENIRLPQAQAYARAQNRYPDGDYIRIAVTDTGYTKHRAIDNPNVLVSKGWNYMEEGADAYDRAPVSIFNNPGHGTSVMSLMVGNDAEKLYGLARNAQAIPIRMTDTVIFADRVKWIRAIDFGIYRKALVSSTSLRINVWINSPSPDELRSINDILLEGIRNGMISFAAAGQISYQWEYDIYPAASKFAIGCTGSNIENKPWIYSLRSKISEIAAPAQEVYVADTTNNDNLYVERFCGTSFSTAIMASVAAIWYAFWTPEWLHANYGKENIFYLFRYLVQKFGINKDITGWDTIGFGPGIIDAERLLKMDGNKMPTRVEVEKYKQYYLSATKHDAYDKMIHFFPGLTKDQVRMVMEQLCQSVPDEPLLEEIRFHLSCNSALRAFIQEQVLLGGQPEFDSSLKDYLCRNASVKLTTLILNQ